MQLCVLEIAGLVSIAFLSRILSIWCFVDSENGVIGEEIEAMVKWWKGIRRSWMKLGVCSY